MQRWTETAQIFSACRGFTVVVLNGSIALAPTVRPVMSSPRVCGFAPRSNKKGLEGWFRSRLTLARQYPNHFRVAVTCWKTLGRWQPCERIPALGWVSFGAVHLYTYVHWYHFITYFGYPVLSKLRAAGVCWSLFMLSARRLGGEVAPRHPLLEIHGDAKNSGRHTKGQFASRCEPYCCVPLYVLFCASLQHLCSIF